MAPKPSNVISSILLIYFLTLTILPKTHAIFSRSTSKEELGLKKEDDQTQLTFYFHDVVSGPSPTVVQIANATSTNTSPTSFGALAMIDDALTEGPENTSKLVGRAQGMYASADQKATVALMVMNFYFLEGAYNGSTLAVLGRNPVRESVREMPVVGGTGAFRFAKGYAQARTHTLDQNTGNAVVQYDVFVSHASSSTASNQSDGGSSGSTPSNGAPASSQASLSKMVSLSFVIPLLCLSIF